MSQHEYETIVEYSITTLDESKNEQLDIRSLCWNLYNFQEMFDTGFTHFRIMDVLLKHHYVYQFDIKQHPKYKKHQQYYDDLIDHYNHSDSDEYKEIYADFDKSFEASESEPFNDAIDTEKGYFSAGKLHCDAGSKLWKRLVKKGLLIGVDAEAPIEIPLPEVVAQVLIEAENKQYTDLIKWWYPALTAGLFKWYDVDDEEINMIELPQKADLLRNDPFINTIREIVIRTKVLEDESVEWWGDFWLPNKDELEEYLKEETPNHASFLRWWFEL